MTGIMDEPKQMISRVASVRSSGDLAGPFAPQAPASPHWTNMVARSIS